MKKSFRVYRVYKYPDPREDPKSRSRNGGSYKVPLVVYGPKLGDLLSRSSRGSGYPNWGYHNLLKIYSPCPLNLQVASENFTPYTSLQCFRGINQGVTGL